MTLLDLTLHCLRKLGHDSIVELDAAEQSGTQRSLPGVDLLDIPIDRPAGIPNGAVRMLLDPLRRLGTPEDMAGAALFRCFHNDALAGGSIAR